MIPNSGALLIASIVSFASNWQFGYQITYVNTAANDFMRLAEKAHRVDCLNKNCSLSYENWSRQWSGIVASIYPGTFLGFVLVPLVVSRWGLKSAFTLSCFPALFGSLLQLAVDLAAENGEFAFDAVMMCGRFLVGIHAGCALCLLPVFFVETSDSIHRPFLSSLQQVFQSVSTLIGFVAGWALPSNDSKVITLQLIALFPTLAFFFFLLLAPNTPIWLLDQWNIDDDEISKSALFYRREPVNLEELKEEAFERWTLNENQSFASRDLKGLAIGSVAAMSFAFTGDDIIDSFSSQMILRHTNGSLSIADQITIGLGILLVLTSICGAFLMDKFGNRRLLIGGLLGTAAANSITAIGSATGSAIGMTFGFGLTKAAIGFGAGAPAWFLTSELVSSQCTSAFQAISTGFLLVAVGTMTSLFLPLDSHLGSLTVLLLCSFPSILCAFLMYLFLPETKDRRPDEIRSHLRRSFFSGIQKAENCAHRPRSYESILSNK